MKIGVVCEQTGLSDRTVRFYTEEGLLSPSYTKNYLGRKTFDFSEADVAMLRSIAVLRKYGFSIPEIKSILEAPEKSVEIIESLRQKKQDTIRSEQELLDALLTLEAGKAYTVPELAEALNTPKLVHKELPEEPVEGCLLLLCKIHFWWICAPLTLFILIGVPFTLWSWEEIFLYKRYYPYFDTYWICAIGWLIPVLCAAAMIFLEIKRGRMHRELRQILIILLTLFHTFVGLGGVMVAAIGASYPPYYSETEDTAHYMILGTMEHAKMGDALELLFPQRIPQEALGQFGQPTPETTRYYNFVEKQDYKVFELYAQWELSDEALKAEKARILEDLSEYAMTESRTGEWVIWSYSGSDPALLLENPTPEKQISYSYLFFAFHEKTGMVRYVASYCEFGGDRPGFLALDWE